MTIPSGGPAIFQNSRHCWASPAGADPRPDGDHAALPAPPAPTIEVRCHRQRGGPYSGGGDLLRCVAAQLAPADGLLAGRAIEITAIAPELAAVIAAVPQTLTNAAAAAERTRLYGTGRTRRLAHGVAELVMAWARSRPEGRPDDRPADPAVITFRELDEADPTDRELVSILMRRCDPGLVTVVAEARAADDELGQALARARRVAALPPCHEPAAAGADLAQLFIESDGTNPDPALGAAYAALAPRDRAARHTIRAEQLAAADASAPRLGALLFHLERGADVAAAPAAFAAAVEDCFARGFYEAALDLALRGRQVSSAAPATEIYWNLTVKAGACLSYLGRAAEALGYFTEIRRGTIDADQHMTCCYLMAMQFTRHLAAGSHDENEALGWVNTAIAIADLHPDPHRRAFTGAFMRNARALVELHRGDAAAALALVNESIAMTDRGLGRRDHLLHRSVLLYNRAQIMARTGEHHAALRDYDEVIRRDPDYGDYYFERAAVRRALGEDQEAVADYAEAIRLNPPFYEAHFNRAGALRSLGDDDGALRDLDYVLELEPDHLDSLVNRTDLLLARGDPQRARADIDRGLALAPGQVNLLCARGDLLAQAGDTVGARASYSCALAQDPGYAPAWANRAAAAYAGGDPAGAVSDLDRAVQLDEDPWLRANRALALHDLGEHRRALDDLDAAITALGDQDPELLHRRAACLAALSSPAVPAGSAGA